MYTSAEQTKCEFGAAEEMTKKHRIAQNRTTAIESRPFSTGHHRINRHSTALKLALRLLDQGEAIAVHPVSLQLQ